MGGRGEVAVKRAAARLAAAAVSLVLSGALHAAQALEMDTNGDGKADQWFEMEGTRLLSMRSDRNNDGRVDYMVRYSARGTPEYEEYDFNYDGKMDDFYFYLGGVLIRQEVDANFDGKVDLWVYLHRGIYIERYEQDTDFDGRKDRVVNYATR
jgi:hypothetical protein